MPRLPWRLNVGSSSRVLLWSWMALCLGAEFVVARSLDARASTPAPIVIPPSGQWEGIDGPWSSFALEVGNPPQSVNTLVSTASHQTWVVGQDGCSSKVDPSNCPTARGGLFKIGQSDTWSVNQAQGSNPFFDLSLNAFLNYNGKSRFGFDDVTLGSAKSGGVTVKNQTIASITTKTWYMGLFGLRPAASSFTGDSPPVPSFMQNLRTLSLIPSTSWAYTAGNQYRSNGVFGSLILGGYDSSRFVANNLTFPFDSDVNRQLSVQVQSIVAAGERPVTLLKSPITMHIDSSLPFIYLPLEACQQFEKTFGLKWDSKASLYLLTDKQHDKLLSKNPSITFTLADPNSATVDITLPYSAFDLTAAYPLVNTTASKYFPLRRTSEDTPFTLGRAFFQEAYVIADYERRSFSVSQCDWTSNAAEKVVAILPLNNNNNSSAPSANSNSSTPGEIAVIPSRPSDPSTPLDSSDSSESSKSSDSPSSTPTEAPPSTSRKVPVVAIAAGVGGGLAAALVVFASCLVFHRRRKASIADAELRKEALFFKQPPSSPPESPPESPPATKAELDSSSTHEDRPLPSPPQFPRDVEPTSAPQPAVTRQVAAPTLDVKQAVQVAGSERNSSVFEMPANEVSIEMMGLRNAQASMPTERKPPLVQAIPSPAPRTPPPPLRLTPKLNTAVQRRPAPIPRKPAPAMHTNTNGDGRSPLANHPPQQYFSPQHVVGSPTQAPTVSPLSATYMEASSNDGSRDRRERDVVSPLSRTGSEMSVSVAMSSPRSHPPQPQQQPPRSRGKGEGKVVDELWLV